MKKIIPDYYKDFCCIASACRHSCCVGWEVDVDPEALARYDRVDGPFGDRLRANIARGDCPHFILKEGERCPFLNGDNLCDIYIELGEDALCQICGDHPRWRNWFADRMEEGLGLCCEEAARLLLTHEGPVTWEEAAMEGETLECDEDYLALLEARERLVSVLQNRSKPLEQRICEAFSLCGLEGLNTDFSEDLEVLLGLEHLESAWPEALSGLTGPVWDEAWDRDGEHLLCYLISRYYVSWGLERWAEEFALYFGVFSLRVLGALYAARPELTLERRVELVRLWSAELEYNEDNLEALADYLLNV